MKNIRRAKINFDTFDTSWFYRVAWTEGYKLFKENPDREYYFKYIQGSNLYVIVDKLNRLSDTDERTGTIFEHKELMFTDF